MTERKQDQTKAQHQQTQAVVLEESQLDAATGAGGVPTDSFSLNFEKIRFAKQPPSIKS